MEYEYVCQRNKDIAYGELLCIMQLFVSSTFIQTHTRACAPASTHRDSYHHTRRETGLLIPLTPALSVSFKHTKSQKYI